MQPDSSLTNDIATKLKSIVGLAGFSDDPVEIAPYMEEWRSKYKGRSPLLLKPATTEQVSAILAVCNASGIAVVPQGGNTGLVGGQIPFENEVLLSLTRLNRIRALDVRDASIILDAGVILETAQDAAEKNGLFLPLSMASKGSCTIGGVISTNAGGVNVLRYGMARAQVLGLEVVLADGQVIDMLRTLRKDNTGYDLKQMFIGAEGTLGIITAAAFRLYPILPERSTALLAVPDLNAALSLLMRLQSFTGCLLDTFEIFPRDGLTLVLKHIPGTKDPFDASSPWYVLCEISGAVGIGLLAQDLMEAAMADELVSDAVIAASEAQRSTLWKLRESLSEAEKKEGPSLKHDVSVPVKSVPEFVFRAMGAVAAAAPDLQVVPFGHLGDGNIHFNIIGRDSCDKTHLAARSDEIARVVYDVVNDFGGSISAEHGIGVLKRADLKRYKSQAEIDLMRMIKGSLDPKNILNPDKLIPE